MIDPFHLHILSILVFVIAAVGIVINLNNLLKVFLCIELMFLAVSINFITYAYSLNNIDGQIFTVFLLTVAAAESAVGLGLLVFYFRQRSTVSVADANVLKE
jgi:NADH-quinone oxidoreductase subunit K